MRKVIFAINISLDGCYDHTKINGNEELHECFTALMQDADLLVYGRKTYQLMVPYWPDYARAGSVESKATLAFAQTFTSIDKVVFSKTLTSTDDKNTTIVRDDLASEIVNLKEKPGKNILVGGIDLSTQLIALELVDEFYIVVHPVIVGAGTKLIGEMKLDDKTQLNLIETKTFESGFVALRYTKHHD
jgi:dihydrofolate reductase